MGCTDVSGVAGELQLNQRKVFGAVFLFVLIAGVLLQWVVIPATPWHAGHGLIAGWDWVSFHADAVKLAEKIEHAGWKAWQLRPEGNAPVGIAAAAYALTSIHEPWVLLPLNGLLYGLAAAVLSGMVFTLSGDRRSALWVVLPMLAFPSAAMIWGQIHKDVWMLPGSLLILSFWIGLGRAKTIDRSTAWLLARVLAGALLVWIVRPYASKVFLLASMVAAAILFAARVRDKSLQFAWLSMLLAGLIIQLIVIQLLNPTTDQPQTVTVQTELVTGQSKPGEPSKIEPETTAAQAEPVAAQPTCATWKQSPPLPLIDGHLAGLACMREGFRTGYPDAGSNIDTDVIFTNVTDIFNYLPRALQISLFAPFPDSWLGLAHSSGGGFMRLIAGAEILVLYGALIGWLWLPWFSRHDRGVLLAVLGFSITAVLIYALVICNVGTLYRMRYPVMLVWIGLGLIGWQRRYSKYVTQNGNPPS